MNCKHEWVVFSTNITEATLIVQCVECGEMGTVNDSSEEEWKQAYHAPSKPYRWLDETRVKSSGQNRLYVVRASIA